MITSGHRQNRLTTQPTYPSNLAGKGEQLIGHFHLSNYPFPSGERLVVTQSLPYLQKRVIIATGLCKLIKKVTI